MKGIKNITVKQFTDKPSAEYAILDAITPANGFAGRTMNINTMPWSNVRYCMRMLQRPMDMPGICQLFEICFDIDADAFWGAGIIEFYQAKRYIIHQFESVATNEAKVLHSQSKDEHLWMMAGADRLKPFADTLPLLQLGKAFGQYPFDLGRKPYSEVFSLLVQLKTQGEVEQEFHKLKTK